MVSYAVVCQFLWTLLRHLGYVLDVPGDKRFLQMLCLTISYSGMLCNPLFLWKILDALEGETKKGVEKCFYLLMGLTMVLVLVNCFYPLFFYVDETGVIKTTSCYGLHTVAPMVVLSFSFLRILSMKIDRKTKLFFASLPFLPVLGAFVSNLKKSQTLCLIYCFMVMSFLLVYSYLFTERSYQLAKSKEELKRKEFARHEQRQHMLMSQIQPHFIFNTLSIIGVLCRKDPDKAYETTVDFADYLRHNLESLSTDPLIPFRKELDHVKKYIPIEKYRFGRRLKIHYDIKVDEFMVLVLSIQPLIENAVRHGILQRKEGGTIKLSTWATNGKLYITVEDDGVGFDMEAIKNDGKVHVGLENIKARFPSLCSATVTVESKVGEGTKIHIEIPVL